MKKIFLLIVLVITFPSCEKDDICDANTPTTPRLIIDFYDSENPAVLKNVTNLKVIGTGMEEGVILNDAATTEGQQYLSNASTIAIPLDIALDNSELRFILNFGNTTSPALIKTDTLDFNYTRRDQYVSRACGFKTLFTLNSNANTLLPIVIDNNLVLEQGSWIDAIEILQSNINDENEVHVKIYF